MTDFVNNQDIKSNYVIFLQEGGGGGGGYTSRQCTCIVVLKASIHLKEGWVKTS